MLTKILAIVHKYMLINVNILIKKVLCCRKITFVWYKKLKLVCIKVINFFQNGAPYISTKAFGVCSTDNFLSPKLSPYLKSFEHVTLRVKDCYFLITYNYLACAFIILISFLMKYQVSAAKYE